MWRFNTTNPPGNELQTAHWLKAVLAREGIEAQVFEPQAGKANLYARLKGDGSARPLILLNHMDVVLATPERSEEHTSELQSRGHLVCRLLLEKKKKQPSHPPRSSLHS